MEKLIRFINEYGHTSSCGPFETYRIEPATDWISSYLVLSRDDNGEGDWKDWHLPVPRLISKEYGFIKRLVENDKIDFDKCGLDVRHYLSYNKRYDKGIVMAENYDNDTFVVREFYSPYEQLLMLLSIQDKPIDFLISILK